MMREGGIHKDSYEQRKNNMGFAARDPDSIKNMVDRK